MFKNPAKFVSYFWYGSEVGMALAWQLKLLKKILNIFYLN